jgi:hypothetical protein
MALLTNMIFPSQRLSYKEKIQNDLQWGKDMIDNLCMYYQQGFQSGSDDRSSYHNKWVNYQLYNNQLDQKEFEKDCNLLGVEVGQFKDEIKPYNKTPNKIQVLLGEEMRRPFTYNSLLVNSTGIRTKQATRTELVKEAILKGIEEFIQLIRSANANPDDPEAQQKIQEKIESLVPAEDLQALASTTYLDRREITAAKILKYLKHQQGIREKMNDAFKHGLISGEEGAWVGVRNGHPVVDVLNSLGLFYDKSPEVKYIQDGRFAGYRTMMAVGDVIDRWIDELTEKDLEKLEGPMQGINGVRDDLIAKDMRYHNVDIYHEYMSKMMDYGAQEGSYGRPFNGDHILVTHVEWKSYRKVYFLTYENEYGDIQKDIVGEEFEIPVHFRKEKKEIGPGKKKTIYTDGNVVIEESWIPEVWEGTRIADDIYVGIRPKPYQHRNADNPYDVKLGYHGLVFNNMNADSISLMDRMKPFQYLYFFVMHKMKHMIAKDKGQVFHFDTSMVPDNMSREKVLYYLEHLDLDIYNSLQNAQMAGASQRGKITGSTNRSNMQHIMNYIQVLEALDMQISDVAGIPKPREGYTPTQQAVTNAQADLQQSSAVTEAVYFQPHYNLWRGILTSLIECAQACWKDKSIVKQFALDDMAIETLELTPDELTNDSIGLFLSNSYEDANIFDTLKAMAQPLIQNDKAKMSDLIKIVKANSIQELEQYIKQSEKAAEQALNMQYEQQQKINQQQIQAQQAQIEDQQAHEKELKQMELDNAIRIKEMEMQANSQSDPLEEKRLAEETRLAEKKLEVEREKIQAQKNKPASK